MVNRFPMRFWAEAGLGVVSATVLAATLVWPAWIEALFGVEPDGGDGSAESGLAVCLAFVTLLFFALAGRTWRRFRRDLGKNRRGFG